MILPWLIFSYISAFAFVLFIGCLRGWFCNKNKWTMPKIKDGVPTKWGWVVRYPENLTLGENTDIGFGTYIQAECGVEIGKNVQIGSHCSIYSINTIDRTKGYIIIRPGARIGAGSVILPRKDGEPLYIGENSIIGALSLVKNNVQDNQVYIKRR